jgi:hypothetical protein
MAEGVSNTPYTALKMALFAPITRASVTTVAVV